MSDRPLPEPRPAPLPALLDDELRRAEQYAASALAPATRKAYDSDWRIFATWCAQRGVSAIPATPATVAMFLASEADREFRPVTIARRAAAIAAAHRAQDHPNPCDSGAVAAVMSGIRRTLPPDTDVKGAADPIDLDPLEQLLAVIDTTTLAGLRDRAVLLLGFAAALRRSELVALDVAHLDFNPTRGLTVRIATSKTDQEGKGQRVAVPYAHARAGTSRCAVRAMRTWLDEAKIYRGAVFRRMRRGDTVGEQRLTAQSVALIVKRYGQAAGLPTEKLSGHSLRAGYITAAASAGVEERKIANVSRHKDLGVLRGYIRVATAFDDVGEVL